MRGTTNENLRHKDLSGVGGHAQPDAGQGRDRRGHLRLGRGGRVVAGAGCRGRGQALPGVSHRGGPDEPRRPVATHVPKPVLRGRTHPHRRHLGHRHRPARRRRQEARRAGLPTSRRQAAKLRAVLRHGRRGYGRGAHGRCASSPPGRVEVHPHHHSSPRHRRRRSAVRAAGVDRADSRVVDQDQRRHRSRARLRYRLPPPAQRCGSGLVLPDDAAAHARLPRRADQGRDTRGVRGPANYDAHTVRHRRGVCVEVAVPALYRTGNNELCAHRRLQRGRTHRGHEGRRLGRGALHRPHAPQSARAHLRRCNGPPGDRRDKLLVARNSGVADRTDGVLRQGDSSPGQPELRGDKVFLSDAPGLGIEVDEASLNEPFRFSESPHPRRRDGSITNW